MVAPITSQIARRVLLMLRHELKEVKDAGIKIRDSGFLYQCLFCGGRPMKHEFLRYGGPLGIPRGMTQEYWDNSMRSEKRIGWIDGRLVL